MEEIKLLEKKVDELSVDIKVVRSMQVEQMKQDAVNLHVLQEHEKRSLLLEERVKPLEDDYTYRARLSAWFLGGSGFVTLLLLLLGLYRLHLGR